MSRSTVFERVTITHRAYLDIKTPNQPDRRFDLTGNRVVLGRAEDAGIQLPFGNVSRDHSCIRRIDEEYVLDDLDSTNGTFVNGTRVVRCVLRNGDQIQVGDTRMLFVEERVRSDE